MKIIIAGQEPGKGCDGRSRHSTFGHFDDLEPNASSIGPDANATSPIGPSLRSRPFAYGGFRSKQTPDTWAGPAGGVVLAAKRPRERAPAAGVVYTVDVLAEQL
jgi:hypothetical protein